MRVGGGPGRDPWVGGSTRGGGVVWEQCAALGWVLTADPSPWELAAVPQQPPESTSLLAVQIAVQIPFSALSTMLSPPSSQTP